MKDDGERMTKKAGDDDDQEEGSVASASVSEDTTTDDECDDTKINADGYQCRHCGIPSTRVGTYSCGLTSEQEAVRTTMAVDSF